ncbi:MAG TPA: hypothetical protein VFZ41_11460 [Solirubrobacterales bacterium]
MSEEPQVDGEIVAEEDVEEAAAEEPVRALEPVPEPSSPVLRGEVKTAAIAAAGGVLAGAATVAAVRAVGAVASRGSGQRGLRRRRSERPVNVVASRSFLVDVHLLGR